MFRGQGFYAKSLFYFSFFSCGNFRTEKENDVTEKTKSERPKGFSMSCFRCTDELLSNVAGAVVVYHPLRHEREDELPDGNLSSRGF